MKNSLAQLTRLGDCVGPWAQNTGLERWESWSNQKQEKDMEERPMVWFGLLKQATRSMLVEETKAHGYCWPIYLQHAVGEIGKLACIRFCCLPPLLFPRLWLDRLPRPSLHAKPPQEEICHGIFYQQWDLQRLPNGKPKIQEIITYIQYIK